MDLKCSSWITFGWKIAVLVTVLSSGTQGQSCGPRVSARLLAEIPCDMSKSSYCSAPGSAYPWSSVKRYINDNQGLVRRMYGDEKHSHVLLNEVDGFQTPYDMLQNHFDGYRSRTVYGRSARGHNKPTRRQPRPQVFEDEKEETTAEVGSTTSGEPATIFRVVTETSIKVGEPEVTQSMVTTQETTSVSYEAATADFENYVTATTHADHTTATQTVETTTKTTTETTTNPTTTASETTYITTEFTTTKPTTSNAVQNDEPIAMERVGYEDFEDEYEYEPKRKSESAALNSVVDKVRYKEEFDSDAKKTESNKYEELNAEDTVAEEGREENETGAGTEESTTEEVPRRGINACPVKNEVIAPYWANNTRGETLALLNVHPFEQYVHFEKCAFENHQMLCREGCRCEQQYRLHRLLAFDPKNECRGIFSDWFRFPSCCVCICYDLTPDMPRTRSRKGRIER
ncbi:hypothetical protein JTE90_022372 [Oedothorax gibbosus]|uniref:Spaetzle domain-containing protein n=1 Tax=Oedothorax gibbosus TaxID=931172 RepID=A0AAV6UPB6_9ARAC|nr:hypothetical protein JTE90_022372 [Oedothorax gibbosus]